MGSHQQISKPTLQPVKASASPNLQKHQQRASSQQQEQAQSLEEMREMRRKFEAAGSTLLLSNPSPPETPLRNIQKQQDEKLENKTSGGSRHFVVPELQMRREEVARLNNIIQARITGQEQDFFIHQDSHSNQQNPTIQRQQQRPPHPNDP